MSQIISNDVMALVQKGILIQPGVYGNQENSPSNDSFNSAVGIATGLLGAANLLKTQAPAPPTYQRTDDNYILTELERLAIENRCKQLSTYGVVPFDTLETFFYILASTTSVQDLEYIGGVIGVPQLGDQRYIRNIRDVCEIDEIYKVGYLSQGVASINQRFNKYGNARTAGNAYQSSFGGIQAGLDLSQSLGVLGPLVLSAANQFNNSGNENLSKSPSSLSSSAITDAVSAFQGLAGGSAMGGSGTLSPTAIQTILNPAASLSNNMLMGGASALQGLLSSSPLGGALSAFGGLGGIVAGQILGQVGGNAVGSFMSEQLFGKRMKSSKIANNPMLTPPSYAGKSFFGEAPVALPAIDQIFCKRVGAFGAPSGGGGVVSFGMQNFASMGSAMSVGSMVSKMITGSPEIPSTDTFFGSHIDSQIKDVANILNVKPTDSLEPRRSDNSIPFMIGMSAAITGEKFSQFGSSTFSNSWKLAASTANDIQKVNPAFLQTARTAL